ncbi:collagen-like protein [Thermoactinomyces sp. DSM 45892]|uniref:collagen-like protein n=1 Tax=Thermoactinomyces sp. DSM 45892 TaxID=1882753 RepID=UPI0008961DB1|nr:collagen-like protein [Thermoactinomyces sp. DSM 45892]SDY04078.1 Collagen triple helix repeat-containing protein [Thermoactinomyces sp. DSM 45892]
MTGPQGNTGPQGSTGPQGPTGADGVAGSTGPQGNTGPQGPTGTFVTGDFLFLVQGNSGSDGTVPLNFGDTLNFISDTLEITVTPGSANVRLEVPTGANGATGPQGNTGPQGPTGADGADGASGPQGNTGPQGPTGADGADGASGPQGNTGPQGPTGADGADGASGPQGNTGPQGPTGADGADGASGPQGNTGPQGPTGVNGTTGPTGATGPTGVNSLGNFIQIRRNAGGVVPTGTQIFFQSVVAQGGNLGPAVGGTDHINLQPQTSYFVLYNIEYFSPFQNATVTSTINLITDTTAPTGTLVANSVTRNTMPAGLTGSTPLANNIYGFIVTTPNQANPRIGLVFDINPGPTGAMEVQPNTTIDVFQLS